MINNYYIKIKESLEVLFIKFLKIFKLNYNF